MGKGAAIKVYARVRPRKGWEGADKSVTLEGDSTIVNKTKRGDMRYTFTKCYPEQSVNKDVFADIAAPMCEQVLDGYNAILVVYGQTGSGKSFTMLGVGGEQEGLMPASLTMLLKKGADLSLSAVEAYGTHPQKVPLFDLLCDKKPNRKNGEMETNS
eukprot:UN34268